MPRVNKTRYAILGVLSMMPGSGYDIKKFCDKGISHFWNENFGHIYPVLGQLEAEGLITRKAEMSEGKLHRNTYSVTEEGFAELRDWLLRPVEQTPERLELLLKLFFSGTIPKEHVIAELEQVRQPSARKLEELLQIEHEFTSNESARSNPAYPYWLATLRYGIGHTRFRMAWCDETIEAIKSHQAPSEQRTEEGS